MSSKCRGQPVEPSCSFADVLLTENSDRTNGTFCKVNNKFFSEEENPEGKPKMGMKLIFLSLSCCPAELQEEIQQQIEDIDKEPIYPLYYLNFAQRTRPALRHRRLPGHGRLLQDGGIARGHLLLVPGGEDGVSVVHERHLLAHGRDLAEAR